MCYVENVIFIFSAFWFSTLFTFLYLLEDLLFFLLPTMLRYHMVFSGFLLNSICMTYVRSRRLYLLHDCDYLCYIPLKIHSFLMILLLMPRKSILLRDIFAISGFPCVKCYQSSWIHSFHWMETSLFNLAKLIASIRRKNKCWRCQKLSLRRTKAKRASVIRRKFLIYEIAKS